MRAALFCVLYVLGGFLFLMLGTMGIGMKFGIGGVVVSATLGLTWFVGGILFWNKFGDKSS